jgi:CDP-6-deoxy-D-xylo-4-hexulose-3-dehydrase
MNEANAAFGLEQLKKLPKFLKIRENNFKLLLDYFSKYNRWFFLPQLLPNAKTNWLAFALTLKLDAPFTRYDLLKHLESKGIQTRVLFSGNITRHPAYKNSKKYRVASTLFNADYIMANSFLIGCHHGETKKDIEYVINVFEEFYEKNKY